MKSGKKKDPPKGNPNEKVRLNKFIAHSGLCSRREADELIRKGKISVNGETIQELGYQVRKDDKVRYGNKTLFYEKPVYILLNKPKDYITTVKDQQGRKTVMNLIKDATKERVFPVGRLDRNTTGLLILTNDGDFANKLTHPSYKIEKIYEVELTRPISKNDFDTLAAGIKLDDGLAFADEVALLNDEKTLIGLKIHIGRNRIIRRMFEHLGYTIKKLDRTALGNLTKKDLPRGKWRYLTEKEVIRLKHLG